ncbi:MAG: hypothetical protein EHM25_07480 [Nitrosopumilales archaeon]|jgi:hypothetical protein|nr:MAG: hypothetical protein EHM25_07480 [Nitrosopumilales archaeon]
MNKDIQASVENSCKKCSHPMSLHNPNCLFKSEENDDDNICGCKDAQYYNTIVSDKYIGWIEIHCNACGKMLGFIDSTVENIYDFTTLCSKCIVKIAA